MSCCECACYDAQFSAKVAARGLKRYRRKGPDTTSRLLLDALAAQGVEGMSVLDVGGGVGVVHHESLARGARSQRARDRGGQRRSGRGSCAARPSLPADRREHDRSAYWSKQARRRRSPSATRPVGMAP